MPVIRVQVGNGKNNFRVILLSFSFYKNRLISICQTILAGLNQFPGNVFYRFPIALK